MIFFKKNQNHPASVMKHLQVNRKFLTSGLQMSSLQMSAFFYVKCRMNQLKPNIIIQDYMKSCVGCGVQYRVQVIGQMALNTIIGFNV